MSTLEKLANKAIDNASASFSKVSTRIWPIWDTEVGDGHVPIIWMMHDLSFPTVFSVRFNDTEVHRSQHEKTALPPVHVIDFTALGRAVKVTVQCTPVSSWGFTSFEYAYKCEVDGLVITENAATGNDPTDRLAGLGLQSRVSVPSFREVPAKPSASRGPSRGGQDGWGGRFYQKGWCWVFES